MSRPTDARARRLSALLLFAATLGIASLLMVELGMRVLFAIQIGPSVLAYGFTSGQERVTATDDAHVRRTLGQVKTSYAKYAPDQVRYDRDKESGERFRVAINSRGLRGGEYTDEKPPGVIRVVTLGASSTFGYYNRDDTTYPVLLEKRLNQSCPGEARYEVINLGIPHLESQEILALFVSEGLALDPDVVTFYEGINDSVKGSRDPTLAASPTSARSRAKQFALLRDSYRFARDHLLLVAFIDNLLNQEVVIYNAAKVEAHFRGKSEHFISSLNRIRESSVALGIDFLVANQQAKSELIAREEIRGVTYEAEQQRVREKLARDGGITEVEMSFLVHGQLMRDVEAWATSIDVPFVDVIAATDQERDILLSWVHLNPHGNELVSDALLEPILALTCQSRVADD